MKALGVVALIVMLVVGFGWVSGSYKTSVSVDVDPHTKQQAQQITNEALKDTQRLLNESIDKLQTQFRE